MSEEVRTKLSETEVNEKTEQADQELCPRCGSERIKRIARVGLMNKFIYPLFDRYPWKCGNCGFTSMLKKRVSSRRRRRHSRHAEENGATTSPTETSTSQS